MRGRGGAGGGGAGARRGAAPGGPGARGGAGARHRQRGVRTGAPAPVRAPQPRRGPQNVGHDATRPGRLAQTHSRRPGRRTASGAAPAKPCPHRRSSTGASTTTPARPPKSVGHDAMQRGGPAQHGGTAGTASGAPHRTGEGVSAPASRHRCEHHNPGAAPKRRPRCDAAGSTGAARRTAATGRRPAAPHRPSRVRTGLPAPVRAPQPPHGPPKRRPRCDAAGWASAARRHGARPGGQRRRTGKAVSAPAPPHRCEHHNPGAGPKTSATTRCSGVDRRSTAARRDARDGWGGTAAQRHGATAPRARRLGRHGGTAARRDGHDGGRPAAPHRQSRARTGAPAPVRAPQPRCGPNGRGATASAGTRRTHVDEHADGQERRVSRRARRNATSAALVVHASAAA